MRFKIREQNMKFSKLPSIFRVAKKYLNLTISVMIETLFWGRFWRGWGSGLGFEGRVLAVWWLKCPVTKQKLIATNNELTKH